DALAHVHPTRRDDGSFGQQLPTLPAGRYALFADIVTRSGFPLTGTATLDIPAQPCGAPAGDDASWAGAARADRDTSVAELAGGGRMRWERPAKLHANIAMPLRFHVENADGSAAELDTYMGMAGHAVVLRAGGGVFAHLHPAGSVAMPALALAQQAIGV